MTKYLTLIALVAALSKTTSAIDANCDYYQDVVTGTTYYVYNSEYPNNYNTAKSCRWYAASTTNIKLSCEVTLPATNNCAGDRLSVSASGNLQLADAQNYCGTGKFEVTSTGNNMNIVFTALAGTKGGRFLCTLQAVTSCNCGWKNPMRIVGGTATGVNEYPMMCGLVNLDQRMVVCGGTIISQRHVLTAAHCRPNDISRMMALVGDHDVSTGADTSSSSLQAISRFLNHPNYNSNTQANDIAIVFLVNSLTYTSAVGPACLPFQVASNSFAGSKLDALGWGTLEFAGATSNVLQKVTLDVTTTASCQRTFPVVTTNQLCTFTSGKDACQFDSGGPLLWTNPSTRRIVSAGCISYGQICADTTPGVNTRVGAYLNWIISETPGANYCRLE